jgi:hypothetical protein
MDFDNGSEFINHDLIGWAAERDIYFTRSRPYKKNDQATIESKKNHVVLKYAYYWRYDTPEALVLLNRLWPLVRDRMNYLTPTKKPVGWASTPDGRRARLFDTPLTSVDRLLASQAVSVEQRQQLNGSPAPEWAGMPQRDPDPLVLPGFCRRMWAWSLKGYLQSFPKKCAFCALTIARFD